MQINKPVRRQSFVTGVEKKRQDTSFFAYKKIATLTDLHLQKCCCKPVVHTNTRTALWTHGQHAHTYCHQTARQQILPRERRRRSQQRQAKEETKTEKNETGFSSFYWLMKSVAGEEYMHRLQASQALLAAFRRLWISRIAICYFQ